MPARNLLISAGSPTDYTGTGGSTCPAILGLISVPPLLGLADTETVHRATDSREDISKPHTLYTGPGTACQSDRTTEWFYKCSGNCTLN